MNIVRASALLWTIACCAPPAAREPPRRTWRETPVFPPRTTSRSAPTAFLDVPGLTQVLVSTHDDDEFGFSDVTQLEVLRAGKVVCELPYRGRSSHEHDRTGISSELVLSSREPLRFHVRTTADSSEFGAATSCTGFELPDNGSCRTLFDRSCSDDDCTLSSTTAVVPGTGKIRGRITRDDEPFVGVAVIVESTNAISDEHGTFSIGASPGAHEIVLAGTARVYSPNVRVRTRSGLDAEVSIAIACPCCRAP